MYQTLSPQKRSGYVRLPIYRDTICPVAMTSCTIRSSPHTRTCNKLQLLDLSSASPQSHIIRICVNSPKWVITTTCDVVYPMFNVHQLKYNDIIGNLGTCHQGLTTYSTICPVTIARCIIRSSPLTRICNKIQLLDLSLDFITFSYYISVNSQKWVITTTCDVVYQIFNALQF